MDSTVIKPFEISKTSGGVLADCAYGLDRLLEDDDTLADSPAPQVTTSIANLTATNIHANTAPITIAGIEYGVGQAILFDLVATSGVTTTSGYVNGFVYIEFWSDGGTHLTHEKAVTVYDRLPSR